MQWPISIEPENTRSPSFSCCWMRNGIRWQRNNHWQKMENSCVPLNSCLFLQRKISSETWKYISIKLNFFFFASSELPTASIHTFIVTFSKEHTTYHLLLIPTNPRHFNMFQLTTYYKQRENDNFFTNAMEYTFWTLRFNVISILYEIVSIFISRFSTLMWCYISGLLARIIMRSQNLFYISDTHISLLLIHCHFLSCSFSPFSSLLLPLFLSFSPSLSPPLPLYHVCVWGRSTHTHTHTVPGFYYATRKNECCIIETKQKHSLL